MVFAVYRIYPALNHGSSTKEVHSAPVLSLAAFFIVLAKPYKRSGWKFAITPEYPAHPISMLRRSVAAFALKIFNPVPSTALHLLPADQDHSRCLSGMQISQSLHTISEALAKEVSCMVPGTHKHRTYLHQCDPEDIRYFFLATSSLSFSFCKLIGNENICIYTGINYSLSFADRSLYLLSAMSGKR